MKQMISIGSRLAIICAVSAIVLALVNSITAPKIAIYQEQLVQQALAEVSSGYTIGEKQSSDAQQINYYHPLTDGDTVVGYVINLTAAGYGGPMTMLAGFSTAGETLAAKLIQNSETPGLGKKAESSEYMQMFVGTGGSTTLPMKKSDLPDAAADSISGATITFSGVAKALQAGSQFAIELGGMR
jgi:Na+-translocating ferredoxin:NAD+ oxidoreductase subunit G